jgi:hypothetical protein
MENAYGNSPRPPAFVEDIPIAIQKFEHGFLHDKAYHKRFGAAIFRFPETMDKLLLAHINHVRIHSSQSIILNCKETWIYFPGLSKP